ncbi:hypothetical protein [Nonomuraea sp. PA05]|uniref:hypothetical protein n=1 Tax=Nonomuraea sp. PA05 TaxID=2604466 RepID=UPI0016522581|nr:hypothetical protein [Nonomuraea sp. PA05]
MYNLTVANIHTYFVTVGNEAVLVHNADRRPVKLAFPADRLAPVTARRRRVP